jgi:hypothetical protein
MTLSTRAISDKIRRKRKRISRNIVSIFMEIVVFTSSGKRIRSDTTSSDSTRIRVLNTKFTVRITITRRTI